MFINKCNIDIYYYVIINTALLLNRYTFEIVVDKCEISSNNCVISIYNRATSNENREMLVNRAKTRILFKAMGIISSRLFF
jgi:hypothetical protein